MTYKAIISDVDGTAVRLSSDGTDVSDSAIQKVQEAKNQGVKIAFATGRRLNELRDIIRVFNITNPCIVEGGTRIIDPKTEETLWAKSLDKSLIDFILNIFKQESDEGLLSTFDLHSQPLDSIGTIDNSSFLYLIGVSPDAASRVCSEINNAGILAVAHQTPSWKSGNKIDIHVTHSEATKGHALKAWHAIEGVSVAETIGLGDSANDLPLFQSSGLKVAVSNAGIILTEQADYIAPNDHQQALEHVIDKFILKTLDK